MSDYLTLNMDFLRAIQGVRTPFWDTVFGLITRFGEELVAIVLLCILYWCVNKYVAYGVGVAYFVSGALVQGLKITCRIPRPWVLDPSFEIVESAKAAATGYSFPSGHTQGATALYGTVGLWTKNKALKIGCIALFVLVGFSRMYLGVHTPSDVVVGMLVALVSAGICVKLFRGKEYSGRRDMMVMLFVGVLSVALFVLATVLHGNGTIDLHYTTDSCKQAGAAVGFALGAYLERRFIRFETAAKNFWMQIGKLLLGLAGVLAIKEGLKLLIGASLAADTFRYFLMVFWIAAIYPLIIKKLFKPKEPVEKPV